MRRLMLALALALAACGGTESTPAGPTEPPTPSPTVEVTAEPTPTPVPLPVKVTKVTRTVSPGDTASITVHTNAGAACNITVLYASGPSEAKGLDAKDSNEKGDVTWRWVVGPATGPQTVGVTVMCEKNGRLGGTTADVEVP